MSGSTGSICVRALANTGIFAVSGGAGIGAGLLLRNFIPSSFSTIGSAFLVPGGGVLVTVLVDYFASVALTKPNGMAAYLVGGTLGELGGVLAEIYLGPQFKNLSAIEISLINLAISSGTTAAFDLIAKIKTCCGEQAAGDEDKALLLRA